MFEFIKSAKNEKKLDDELGKKVISLEFRERGYAMISSDGNSENIFTTTPWNFLLASGLSKEYFYRCMDTIQTTGLTVDDARSIFETAGALQRDGVEKEPLHTAIQMKLKEKNILPDEKEFMKDFG